MHPARANSTYLRVECGTAGLALRIDCRVAGPAAVRSALVEQFVHRCGGHGEARQNCDLDDAHGGVSP